MNKTNDADIHFTENLLTFLRHHSPSTEAPFFPFYLLRKVNVLQEGGGDGEFRPRSPPEAMTGM